jgi:hypothetical protein
VEVALALVLTDARRLRTRRRCRPRFRICGHPPPPVILHLPPPSPGIGR